MEHTRQHVVESDETGAALDVKPSALAQLRRAMPVLNRMFAVDLRSLAALRISMAVVVLLDLGARVGDVRPLYSDEGVMTRPLILETLSPWHWSLNYMNGTAFFQQATFFAAMLAAVFMLIGYKTRLMTFVVWVLVVSIQLRNPMLISGGDTLLRLLLLWSVFAPMGAVWSVDRQLNPEPKRFSMSFLSFGSAGIFLQIAFMYWFTAALKWQNAGDDWQGEHSALFYTLGRELYRTGLGGWMHQFTTMLEWLTIFTLAIEFIAPVLLFMPFWSARLRMIGIVGLLGLQFGIFTMMDIGIFPRISIVCMLVFLPAWFWDVAMPWVKATVQARSGRFGEVRGALQRSVQGAAQAIRPARANLSFSAPSGMPGQEPTRREILPSAASAPTRETADERPPEQPARARSPMILNVFAAFLLVFIFAWNMTSVTAFEMPAEDKSNPIAYSLAIYQNWHMFAPPTRQTTWYVMVGTLQDGQQVEMLYPIIHDDMSRVEPIVSWEQLETMDIAYYKDIYWRMYLARVGTLGTPAQQASFAAYVCREWNDVHVGSMQVVAVQYLYLSQAITPAGSERGEQIREVKERYDCG